ncbi:glycoside hydrolase family 5 protein [uncultured Ruminococcus sp.]|uniref:glycoside hydrolase family 5 protein n=1 Tax=uncultured Ruminococcus sp. TaxID=165186 RepID=UPI0025D648F6|nr:glycoside hydrolase family 5 protein [uncultured Ruminococcus sp.]
MKIKNIKKIFAAALALTMGMSMLTACGSNSKNESSADSAASSGTSSAGSEESGSDVSKTHTNDPMTVTSAKDLVAQMKVGWNLGNTMDATGGSGIDAETSWGNITTTKMMIDAVKNAGFNVFRLPVSWGTHLDENYNVDPAWMDRVQEIVNYGIDNDMFVILNTHHEEWYMPVESDVDEDLKELEALWTQIAERFKGYNEKLIFEGVNEPRLRGDGAEWTGTTESREIVNKYAKTFVETVRATGGNNADRCLMVTPYAASSSATNMQALEIPEDSDKIIVSIHAYLPYSFALDTAGTDVYDPNDKSIPDLFENIKYYFLDNDIPVIIGEFGSVNKMNDEDRIKCVTDYLTTAKEYGVPCIWWDNGTRVGDGENFGLLDRTDCTWYFPGIMEAIQNVVNS